MGEFSGHEKGLNEAAGVCFALPRDVAGGAVVDAGSDDWKAEGGVHRGIERESFQWDVALVVVHADEGIGCPPAIGEESGVGRNGAFDADALGLGGADGGDNDFLFLSVSEETVFAGVRVKSEHPKKRVFGADFCHGVRGEPDDFEDSGGGECLRNLGEANVDGDEACADFVGILHHAGGGRVAAGREDFGVAGEAVSCGVEGFFAEGRGGDGVDLSGEGVGERGVDVFKCGGPCGGGDDSGLKVCCGECPDLNDAGRARGGVGEKGFVGEGLGGWRKVEGGGAAAENLGVAVDDGGTVFGDFRVMEDAETDFGTDSSGVAHGDRDEGRAHKGCGLASG